MANKKQEQLRQGLPGQGGLPSDREQTERAPILRPTGDMYNVGSERDAAARRAIRSAPGALDEGRRGGASKDTKHATRTGRSSH